MRRGGSEVPKDSNAPKEETKKRVKFIDEFVDPLMPSRKILKRKSSFDGNTSSQNGKAGDRETATTGGTTLLQQTQ
jgi:hypothetical protein